MLHLPPLFIEMLFCYQIWHTKKEVKTTRGGGGKVVRSIMLNGCVSRTTECGWRATEEALAWIRFWMSTAMFSLHFRELFIRAMEELRSLLSSPSQTRQRDSSIHVLPIVASSFSVFVRYVSCSKESITMPSTSTSRTFLLARFNE